VLPGPEQAAFASSHDIRHHIRGERLMRRIASVEGEENVERE